MIDIGPSVFEPGMAYVALSRAKTFDRVFIIEFVPESLVCNKDAVVEYKRQAKFNGLPPPCDLFNKLPYNNLCEAEKLVAEHNSNFNRKPHVEANFPPRTLAYLRKHIRKIQKNILIYTIKWNLQWNGQAHLHFQQLMNLSIIL